MFEQNPISRWLVRYTTLVTICGFLVWVATLIHGAILAKNAPIGQEIVTKLGPFELNEFAKQALTDGYTIHFGFRKDIIWYFCGCLGIGLLAGVVASLFRRKNTRSYH